MRRRAEFAVIATTMVLMSHAALAQSPWYISGSVGALWRFDASRSTTFTSSTGATGPGTDSVTYDPGPFVAVAAGYRLPLGFRIEGEFGYAHYAIANASPLSTDGTFPRLNGNRLSLQSGGDYDSFTGTLNGFYDLPLEGRVIPYIGAGAGVAHNNAQAATFAGAGGTPVFSRSSGSTTYAIILAEVGATIAIDDHWSVVPSYRYEHQFTSGNQFSNDVSIVKLGVRYAF